MALRKFLTVLRRRFRLVGGVLLIVVLGTVVASAMATRAYTATAGLYFSVRTAASVDDLAQGATFTQTALASYANLAVTPEVLEPVALKEGIVGGAAALSGQVKVTAVSGTVLLDVSVKDTDAVRAARLANDVADQLIFAVQNLSPSGVDGTGSAVQASVVAPAGVPTSPSSPKTTLNVLGGVVLGLALGIVLALVREALDTRVRNAAELAEVTGTPLLGTLGVQPGKQHRVLLAGAPHSPQAEAYRQLRTSLQFLNIAGRSDSTTGGPRVITVTSSLAAEGKSTVAANLAVALAETGARVLLVDADLRRPSVADVLGLEGAAGLTTVLLGRAGVADVVQDWGSAGLQVLTAGPLPPNPSELLGSLPMRRLLDELRAGYDHVILDSAPLLPVTDGAVLSGLADGAVLVVDVTRARRHQVAEAVRNLAQVEASVLGVVLNKAARDERSYGYQADEKAVSAPAGRPETVQRSSVHAGSGR